MKTKLGTAMTTAVAMALGLGAAQAADLPVYEPYIEPLPEAEVGGWYLRGYIGISNQRVDELDSPAFTPAVTVLDKGFDAGGFFGGGIGYEYNHWLRFDVTGEYRAATAFDGLDSYPGGANDYEGKKSEWLFLANAYVDLGTWRGITPYVGAGIGASRNTISDFTDVNIVVPGGAIGYSTENSKWNFAWALHAGVGYEVTENLTLDLAYRYVDLGDAETNDLVAYTGANPVYNPIEFHDITSHDVMFGLRYRFGHSGGGDYFASDYPVIAKN